MLIYKASDRSRHTNRSNPLHLFFPQLHSPQLASPTPSIKKAPHAPPTPPTEMAMSQWFLLLCIFFISASASNVQTKVTDNPADQLLAVLNSNRTAHKLSSLYSNPGLACLALQYIKAYQGDCSVVGGPDGKKPAESEFAETFAPNCNVEASSLAQITGRFLACQSKYAKPSEAFNDVLIRNSKSLDILYSKNHTEVGAAVSGSDGGGPYFWCVLFSNGKANSSFTTEGGEPKVSRPGCFSGSSDQCNSANTLSRTIHLWSIVLGAFVALFYALGV